MHRPVLRNLTYDIVEQVGFAIVTGVYTAGNPFPIEAGLCEQYGASRSVLRETEDADRRAC